MIDPVPWLVGGGAVHSAAVSRALGFVAVGGSSGIAEGTNLKVTELATPGTSVKVGVGAFAIKNTYPGQTSQSYVGFAPSETNLAITATGGAIRSDMVVLRIDDPEFGGTTPPDVTVGPYVRLDIISNVGGSAVDIPGGTAYPCIPLARIDIPVSTATITNAMITDLRKVIAPKRQRDVKLYQPSVDRVLTSASPTFMNWPSPSGWDVDIPEWASEVIVIGQMAGIACSVQGATGSLKIRVGIDGDLVETQVTNFNLVSVGGGSREFFVAAGRILIPEAYRGTTQNFSIRGTLGAGTGTQRPNADAGSTIILDVDFVEAPAS